MVIGDELLKMLNKLYEPSTFMNAKFKRYDVAFKTDDTGRPILLFIGKTDADGKINGERFARKLVTGTDGGIIKDHWDNKGKIS